MKLLIHLLSGYGTSLCFYTKLMTLCLINIIAAILTQQFKIVLPHRQQDPAHRFTPFQLKDMLNPTYVFILSHVIHYCKRNLQFLSATLLRALSGPTADQYRITTFNASSTLSSFPWFLSV